MAVIRDMEAAVMTALKAKFPSTVAEWPRVYLVGDRPAIPVGESEKRAFFPFVSVFPSRRFASDRRRLSDDSSVIAFRVVTVVVGMYPEQVAYAVEKVTEALEGVRLSISGYSSTPIHFENGDAGELDPSLDEWITSTLGWTFVSTVQQAA